MSLAVGWRPYYNGYWHHGRGGALVWVSYEPWGWVPYHYGRWSFAPTIGWVWLPGGGYSPAWVYWMYGPGYIGWAPAGWYDCFGPYYGWAYRPYARAGFGFGFYGRVRVHDIDLRPWTFVSPGHIVSTRIDRAALTTDVIRQRLARDGGGFATVSGAPARFSRSEIRDPATAVGNIIRRGHGGGTGREGSGSAADMTSFFRRDPALSGAVRENIVRSRIAEVPPSFNAPRGVGSGIPTPGTGGTLEGRVPRDGGGSRHQETPATGTISRGSGAGTIGGAAGDWRSNQPATGTPRDNGGSIHRGGDSTTTTPRDSGTTTRDRGNWRDRFDRPSTNDPKPPTTTNTPPSVHDRSTVRDRSVERDNWRGRGGNDGASRGSVRESSGSSGRNDVPRRIIDSIGGSRITSGGDRGSRSSGGGNSGGSGSGGGGRSGNSGGGSHSSGNSGGSHSSNSGSSKSSGGGEGHVKRN